MSTQTYCYTNLLIYTSWLCIPSILDIQDTTRYWTWEQVYIYILKLWDKADGFWFSRNICENDNALFRRWGYCETVVFLQSRNPTLCFAVYSEVWQDFWCCDSEVGFLCEEYVCTNSLFPIRSDTTVTESETHLFHIIPLKASVAPHSLSTV